ncbi:hypothetical protein IB211_01499c [Intestinimonas butyriciproducens]|uniref:Uncharacterized protein n=1 Tax=Intestinimonas butyriciproducens TaxID=1297617 RepID=A0A0S2W3G0_9FIRM|nr:hypothetical protein IB211_01499c [Intestinimonas butyriciproducens]
MPQNDKALTPTDKDILFRGRHNGWYYYRFPGSPCQFRVSPRI